MPGDARAIAAARQMVETSRLLGTDVVPVSVVVPTPAPMLSDLQTSVVSGEAGEKQRRLEDLHARHDAECQHCTAATAHTRTVFGEGNPDARLMFVGEAPGAEEDRQGRPFVGRSGQLLDKIIAAMGLSRADVYIANVLKSRPPNNATPTSAEASLCGPYLKEQVRIIRPEVIVTLGKPAANLLLKTSEAMGALRGTWREYDGIPVMPTFHPAYLLRSYTPENRALVWSDMQQVMSRLGIAPERAD